MRDTNTSSVCHAYIKVALECVYLSRIFTHHFRAVTYTGRTERARVFKFVTPLHTMTETHTTRVEFVVLCTDCLSCDGSAVAVTSVHLQTRVCLPVYNQQQFSMYMERAICEQPLRELIHISSLPSPFEFSVHTHNICGYAISFPLPLGSFCPLILPARSARSRGGSVE